MLHEGGRKRNKDLERRKLCHDPLHLICTTNGERREKRVGRKRGIDGERREKGEGEKC